MRTLVFALGVGLVATSLSSCFLVSIPVKATGEMIEKGAHATGDAMNRGFHRMTRPDGGRGSHQDDWQDNSSDDYNSGDLEHLPPLLPQR